MFKFTCQGCGYGGTQFPHFTVAVEREGRVISARMGRETAKELTGTYAIVDLEEWVGQNHHRFIAAIEGRLKIECTDWDQNPNIILEIGDFKN